MGNTLTHRARNRQRIQVQQVLLRELLHDSRNSARLVQILHMMRSCRAQLRNIRRTSADLIEERRRELDPCLVRDRSEVQYRVRRATNAHIDRNRILEGFKRHDITRTDIFFNEIENDCPRLFCKQATLTRIGCGNRSITGKPHAEHFGQGVHRIRCEQSGTGTAARAGVFLNRRHFMHVHLTCSKHPRSLERLTDTDVTSAVASRKHGTSTDEDCRDIETCRRHEHPRHNLIAVRNEDKPVKSRCHRNGFDGVRNQLTACKGVFHPRMPHRNSITNADRRKFNRRSTCGCHAKLHSFRNRIQMKVPRNDLVK